MSSRWLVAEANLLFLDSPFGVGYSVRSIVEQDGDNSTGRDFQTRFIFVFHGLSLASY